MPDTRFPYQNPYPLAETAGSSIVGFVFSAHWHGQRWPLCSLCRSLWRAFFVAFHQRRRPSSVCTQVSGTFPHRPPSALWYGRRRAAHSLCRFLRHTFRFVFPSSMQTSRRQPFRLAAFLFYRRCASADDEQRLHLTAIQRLRTGFRHAVPVGHPRRGLSLRRILPKIGRASCRARV